MVRKKTVHDRACPPSVRHGRDDVAQRSRHSQQTQAPPAIFNQRLPVEIKECEEPHTSDAPAESSTRGSRRGPASRDAQPSLTLSLVGGPKVDVSVLPTSQLLVSFSPAAPRAATPSPARKAPISLGTGPDARDANLENALPAHGGSESDPGGARGHPTDEDADASAGPLPQGGVADESRGIGFCANTLKGEASEKEAVQAAEGTASGNQPLTVRSLLKYLKGLRSHIDSIAASRLEPGSQSKRQSCDGETSFEDGGNAKPLDARALSAGWDTHGTARGGGEDRGVPARGPHVPHVNGQTREPQGFEDPQPATQVAGPRPRVRHVVLFLALSESKTLVQPS